MNAIILAGGFGSRLKPLTDDCPKPMLKVANRPMLDYVVAQLHHYGIDDMVFTLGYMPEKVSDYVNGYKGIKSRFSVESTPLGTAGGVKKAEEYLDDVFFVISGDALSDVNLLDMVSSHFTSGAEVTIASVRVDDPTRYGVLKVDESGRVKGIIEKPNSNAYGNLVSSGIYIVNKSVLSQIPNDVPFDFAKNLFPQLIENGKINAYFHDGYWCDIGDKKTYFNANFYMSEGGFFDFVENDFTIKSEIACGNMLSEKAVTVGKVRNSIVGSNSKIASCASVDECVILDGVTVRGKHFHSIIGNNFVEKISLNAPFRQDMSISKDNLFVR